MTEYIGMAYPLDGTVAGTFDTKSTEDIIRTSILSIILTRKGERVMLPEFGSNIRELLFDPIDDTLQYDIQNAISDAVRVWDNRIDVKELDIKFDHDHNQVHISCVSQRKDDPESVPVTVDVVLTSTV